MSWIGGRAQPPGGRARAVLVPLGAACSLVAASCFAPAAAEPGSPATAPGGSTCLSAQVRWGPVGVRIDYREESRLLGCREFVQVRDAGEGETSCANQVPPNRIAGINAALADPDVGRALAEAPPASFGSDLRLVGGVLLRIEVGGRAVQLGGPCRRPGASCRPVPSGLAALAARLGEVKDRQLELPSCAGLRSSESPRAGSRGANRGNP